MTSQHHVMVTDAHAIVVGTWGVAGTEWRRAHLRLLLKRGGSSYFDLVVWIPDELLHSEEFANLDRAPG